jgi:hypothetical protein
MRVLKKNVTAESPIHSAIPQKEHSARKDHAAYISLSSKTKLSKNRQTHARQECRPAERSLFRPQQVFPAAPVTQLHIGKTKQPSRDFSQAPQPV